MKKVEAVALAAQLGYAVKTVRAFEELVEKLGFSIGVDNFTGDWVVLDSSRTPVARTN